MSERSIISGKIIKSLFYNESNYYLVASFELNDMSEKRITIVGYFKDFKFNQLYELTGNYIEHAKYGMQFAVQSIDILMPSEKEEVIRFLSSELFKGIGRKYAQVIVDELGEDCIALIKENESILDRVSKMNDKRKHAIINGIEQSQDELQKNMSFFQSHGLGLRSIIKIDCTYGSNAVSIVRNNPYQLIEDIDGIGFKTADHLALSLGFERDSSHRLEAALVSGVMDTCMASGDSYVSVHNLPEILIQKCGIKEVDIEQVLQACLDKKMLVQEENRIYHYTQYLAEIYTSRYLETFPIEKLVACNLEDVFSQIEILQKENNIQYEQKQTEAIVGFFKNDISICTGGPGTGKTTVVRAMVNLFRRIYPNFQIACCAPTGRAAKRLAELTGVECSTIHSLLRWDLETNSFGKNEIDPLQIDCLIIDEFSMVDSWLFANLLRAGAQIKKICIIGDEGQLPSVSCGKVLADLIDSKCFGVYQLERIYRQVDGSGVINLAHHVRNEQVEQITFEQDVAFFECQQQHIKELVLQVVNKAKERGFGVDDIQVLAAKYSGVSGIDMLNRVLQDCLNPKRDGIREYRYNYRVFRENDKILQLKNQIDDDVYNGDIGTLVEIVYPDEDEMKQLRFYVDFDGIIVDYTLDKLINITHAYCISVHKSQGSEYPIVILPIASEASFMLYNRFLYTAITRAKQSLILIGDKEVFLNSVVKKSTHERNTTLVSRLKGDLEVNL